MYGVYYQKKTEDEDYLMHHGVMGMKWGVRRYQNADGTLTTKGKDRFREVASDSRLAKKDTKAALKLYRKNTFIYKPDKNSEYYRKKAEKAKEKHDEEKVKKYIDKAKSFEKMSNVFNKKISEIESGKIKAGRDFIIQRDYDVFVLPPVFASVTRTTKIIEKPKNDF